MSYHFFVLHPFKMIQNIYQVGRLYYKAVCILNKYRSHAVGKPFKCRNSRP